MERQKVGHSPLRVVIFLASLLCSITARADLASFCTSAPLSGPGTDALQALYAAQCPAYLQGQFSSAAASNASAGLTTQLTQQQSQATIDTSIAGLIKPPAAQVASGSDIGALAIASQLQDAQLTYELAKRIGAALKSELVESKQVLLVASASERAVLLATPVDVATVLANLNIYTASTDSVKCPKPGEVHTMVFPMAAALGAEALFSIAATATSIFQGQLLATGKTSGVTDPSALMLSGLAAGLEENKQFLHLQPPAVTVSNSVLGALQKLRVSVNSADVELAKCPKAGSFVAENQKVLNAKTYINSLVQTAASQPTLLDLAARRAALADANIKYTLLLQRDVSGGGASAIKPNWFQGVKIVMATADLITYELVSLDGKVKIAAFDSGHWTQTCKLSKWHKSFEGCR